MEDVTSPDPRALLTGASFPGTAGLGGKVEETRRGPIMNPHSADVNDLAEEPSRLHDDLEAGYGR